MFPCLLVYLFPVSRFLVSLFPPPRNSKHNRYAPNPPSTNDDSSSKLYAGITPNAADERDAEHPIQDRQRVKCQIDANGPELPGEMNGFCG